MISADQTQEEKLIRELIREWKEANTEYVRLLNSHKATTRWIMINLLSNRLKGLENRLSDYGVTTRQLVKL